MKKLTALITFLSVFLVACQGSADISYSGIDYFSGGIGLELRFLEGTPPRRVYVGDADLDVVIEIYNKGTQDIPYGATKEGYLSLSGFDTTFFQLEPFAQDNFFEAEGKSEYNPLGEIYSTKEFNLVTNGEVNLPDGVSKLDQTIKATACYPYKTKAAEKVCIDSDIRNLIRDKVCRVHDISTNGQGAPISITSIEQDVLGTNVVFKVHFANTGGGDVYYSTGEGDSSDLGVEQCSRGSITYTDMNKIRLNHAYLGGTALSCKPTTLRLTGNSGYMICKCEGATCVKQEDAYETLLEIELEYGYRQSIQQPLSIIKIPSS